MTDVEARIERLLDELAKAEYKSAEARQIRQQINYLRSLKT